MKRRNKSCLGVFVIGLFTVYIFIVYRWFFHESAGSKIQQDNLPTDSGMFERKGMEFYFKNQSDLTFKVLKVCTDLVYCKCLWGTMQRCRDFLQLSL